jgi:hypothetical protein
MLNVEFSTQRSQFSVIDLPAGAIQPAFFICQDVLVRPPGLLRTLPTLTAVALLGRGAAGTTINGVAFNASAMFPTAGLDGLGTGLVTLSDSAGHSCAATSFSWALFSQT